jgi:hypothetical protein
VLFKLALAAAPIFAVLVAVVFGTLTLIQWQRTRFLSAAAELVHTMQATEFTRAIARLMELPVDAPAERVLEDKETAAALYLVSHMFESLGVLVYHRLIPLHLVDHLIGGYVRASWKRVHVAITARRVTFGAMFGEWYEWLYDRLEQYPAPGKKDGAANAFKVWKP